MFGKPRTPKQYIPRTVAECDEKLADERERFAALASPGEEESDRFKKEIEKLTRRRTLLLNKERLGNERMTRFNTSTQPLPPRDYEGSAEDAMEAALNRLSRTPKPSNRRVVLGWLSGAGICVALGARGIDRSGERADFNARLHKISLMAEEILAQREQVREPPSFDAYPQTLDETLLPELNEIRQFKFSHFQLETPEDMAMATLAPLLDKAVQIGAGYFISKVVALYPRFVTESVNYKSYTGDSEELSLTDEIAQYYPRVSEKNALTRPDTEFPTPELLIRKLQTIAFKRGEFSFISR